MKHQIEFDIPQSFLATIRSARKVKYRMSIIVDESENRDMERSNADRNYRELRQLVICGRFRGEFELETFEYEETVRPEMTQREINHLINRLVDRSCDYHHIALSSVLREGDVAVVDFDS